MDCYKPFFTIFRKFKWQITDRLKKWKRAHRQTWRHVSFHQKGHGAQKKGHGVMKKGHGAAPFYFSLDKTIPFESRQRNDTKYQPQCSTVELYIFCLNLFSKRLITSIFLLNFFLFKWTRDFMQYLSMVYVWIPHRKCHKNVYWQRKDILLDVTWTLTNRFSY